MGISYEAAVIVGLPKNEIPIVEDLLDEDVLDQFPYYFDCDEPDILCGFEIQRSYGYGEYTHDPVAIQKALAKFKELTGLDGKTWLTVVSW